jgi:hypothetical protein
MFTTGSKLLIGSAVAAWIFAAVYGVAQEGALGTIGLISAAGALTLLASLNVFVRDSNVSAVDAESFESSAAAQATARPSLWPLTVGLGATAVTLGLATFPAIFVLGIVLIVAGAVEWMIQGWSERASGDRRFNSDARNLFADPLEMPVAGAIMFAVVAFAFSRVMLGLPSKTSTVVAFSVLAAIVLVVGTTFALRRGTSKTALTGVLSVGAIALIAGGAFAGINGERETHEHETTGTLAEEDQCGVEETEADENASQTVAAKSNVAAELIYDGSELEADVPGFDGDFETLQLPRSTPTNVLFRNESDGEARLVLELHPAEDANGVVAGPERVCTALVEEGGVQLITFEFDRPSFALEADGVAYEFTVAGSDATLGVVVP